MTGTPAVSKGYQRIENGSMRYTHGIIIAAVYVYGGSKMSV